MTATRRLAAIMAVDVDGPPRIVEHCALYKSSVGRWRAYDRFLGSLLVQFEPSCAREHDADQK
jgi:hypothetical protein